uniref:RNA-directed DNA polymerase, eukaryota, reverse transcriptase zinc-binding domain protein n=1 Tax=Tanacetum cinerariifolium TaxID=118510 RepID=A0A6L2NP25_TANCI|nr:RNA-directed DNA polymerase, eukaryota, reverse transcriptase zinc-binding domain protein [Tanacetum cinerariifolium]
MGLQNYKHEDGWTWIFRKRDHQESRISNLFNNDVKKISESFYITNFPDHVDAKELWKVCEPFGRIVDAYIARKQSKLGKCFGFVRFIGTISRSTHLQIPTEYSKPQAVDKGKSQSDASTYASVVHGGTPKYSKSHQQDGKKSITLHDSDLIKIDDSLRVLLAKVKDIGTMSNIYRLCMNESFMNISIHHVGGLWLWFQFLDSKQCVAFKNNLTMKSFFSYVKNVSQNFIVDKRTIWIEINRLPLCGWDYSTLKKVASLFGKFIFSRSIKGLQLEQSINIDKVQDSDDETSEKEDGINNSDIAYLILEDKLDEVWLDNHIDNLEEKIKKSAKTKEHLVKDQSHASSSIPNTSNVNKASTDSEDMSCPPGFEHLKHNNSTLSSVVVSSSSGKCSTMFSKYRKKVIKIISLLHEMNHIIKVRGALGYNESKMTRLELFRIKSIWGNHLFDYAVSMALGFSGGLISIWDPSMFVQSKIWCSDHFIILQGKWSSSDDIFYMVNIYGSQNHVAKVTLWDNIITFIHHHSGKYVLFGDFNEVRNKSERFGSSFSTSEAHVFNNFIDYSALIEIPMGGRRFTWMNKEGSKLCKLDRFLLSDFILDSQCGLVATVLEHGYPDHNPILLHVQKSNYGPIASLDEIKQAVWYCGSSKSPGPDGFSFLFLKKYWDLLKFDVETFVLNFMSTCKLPPGTNSTFITLILKVSNSMLVKDYRPISLIGMHYKIIAKLLANRLAKMVDKVVSQEQSAFIPGRQILDGPLMLSEIINKRKFPVSMDKKVTKNSRREGECSRHDVFKENINHVLKMLVAQGQQKGRGGKGVDFLETSKKKGMTIPRPRWRSA